MEQNFSVLTTIEKFSLCFFVVVAIYLVYPKVAHYPQYEMKIMYRLT